MQMKGVFLVVVAGLVLLAGTPGLAESARDEYDHHHGNFLERILIDTMTVIADPNIKITYNLTTQTGNGDWINVSWSGVSSPSINDYIALYAPANVSVYNNTQLAPVKIKFCNVSANYLTTGAGSTSFRLLNLRTDSRFSLLRGGFGSNATLAAQGPVLPNSNPGQPTGGHLALTNASSEMVVQWTTLNSTNPMVKYGTTSGTYSSSASANISSYAKSDLCAGGATTGPGWFDPGQLATALMTGLKPATRYYYVYGDSVNGFAPEASFVSAPVTAKSTSVKIVLLADMGQSQYDGSTDPQILGGSAQEDPSIMTIAQISKAINNDNYTLIVHEGDLAYADGYLADWEAFMDLIQPVASQAPYMVLEGNHERDFPKSGDNFNNSVTDSRGECGVVTRARFPSPLTDGPTNFYYSFNYGPVHFLQYSTEVPYFPGSDQYEWMANDLDSVNRSVTPWVVVGGHRPVYIVSNPAANTIDSDAVVSNELQTSLEELWFEYGVDLTLQGHTHTYQRTCPVYQRQCVSTNGDGSNQAPVHIVIGNAGRKVSTFSGTPPAWNMIRAETYGYARMQANATALSVQAYASNNGTLLDSFTLVKPIGYTQPAPGSVFPPGVLNV